MTPKPIPFGPIAIARAAEVVGQGGLIVFPTDTVYGLGCDPLNAGAVRRLFAAKGREGKAVPVLCASMSEAEALVVLNARAHEIARRFWPGPLTVVAPLAMKVPEMLHQGSGALGVRVPGSGSCVRLIRACGGRLVGTSANISGKPSSRTAQQAEEQLGKAVDLIIDGGRLVGPESTVVRVSGDDIIILRKGSVGVDDLAVKN